MKQFLILLAAASCLLAAEKPRTPLDPKGKVHIPIGVANTLDTLKTFVEAEGNFSPGFGSYGIYFWVRDEKAGRLFAPTMEDVKCEHGLMPGGLLIPWSRWSAGEVEVTTEICAVKHPSPAGELFVDGARVILKNRSDVETKVSLYVALRPLGPAGWEVREIGTTKRQLDVDGHMAVWASEEAAQQIALPNDTIAAVALAGLPVAQSQFANTASSTNGDCSGALRFEVTLPAKGSKTLGFVCPVLAGRRAVGHAWDGVSPWAQFDLSKPNPPEDGGKLQPDPGEAWWAGLNADDLFERAVTYWRGVSQRTTLKMPDSRWAESFAAIVSHAALCMNENAPDVAVVNYNVFNRDGMYLANIFQKSGNNDLSEAALDYFLAHPFNGRVQPEADNPGQILWAMGEHWKFTRDLEWLRRTYFKAQKLAAMIGYYRTTPGPHWVSDTSLEFGDKLPAKQRKELKPGACDGVHPEYTEAYDIAGLRQAITLAEAVGNAPDATAWKNLAASLFDSYAQSFGTNLARGYGSYAVLWPTRLYPFDEGQAHDQFKSVGAQKPTSWRYFPLAKAHQGLLAGNRAAGFETLNTHLDHPQMRGWYAFDEGGDSGTGGWNHVLTRWRQGKVSDAMPHAWSIAEFVLLLRDSLLYEDGEKLVLFAGVAPEWFTHPTGMNVREMPTPFGRCSIDYVVKGQSATVSVTGVKPPGGLVLRLPTDREIKVTTFGNPLKRAANGDVTLPANVTVAELQF